MKYMLDTNICIYTIKQKPEAVIRNFLKRDPDEICISAITYAELMHGVEKSQARPGKETVRPLPCSFLPFPFWNLITMRQRNTAGSGQNLKEKGLQSVRWTC